MAAPCLFEHPCTFLPSAGSWRSQRVRLGHQLASLSHGHWAVTSTSAPWATGTGHWELQDGFACLTSPLPLSSVRRQHTVRAVGWSRARPSCRSPRMGLDLGPDQLYVRGTQVLCSGNPSPAVDHLSALGPKPGVSLL